MPTPKSKKGRKIAVLVVILLVIGGLTALAVFRKREPVITVQTDKVTRRSLTEVVVANGRIQPVFQVKISPEVSGEIIELPVKEGQKVKKGDLLLKIKPDVYVAARNSSEASYKASVSGRATAQANLQRAEADYRRIAALSKAELVSESAYLDAETQLAVTKAQLQSATHQVEMAEAALRRAEEDLAKTTIASPLDGTVSRLNSQLGERVVGTAMMAGTEVMTIADLNEMEARVDVGEVDVVLIQIGQKARLEVDAFKDRKFSGSVTEIANSSKAAGYGSGSSQDATRFEVKIRIAEKEPFRPGMTVTAEIETRYRTNVLTVPVASVTTRMPKPPTDPAKGSAGGAKTTSTNPGSTNAASTTNVTASGNAQAAGTSTAATAGNTNATDAASGRKPGESTKMIEVVFVKDGEHAKMVPVKRGISDESYVEITDGLSEGQEVVSGGHRAISRELEDGKKIRVGKPGAEAAKEKEASK